MTGRSREYAHSWCGHSQEPHVRHSGQNDANREVRSAAIRALLTPHQLLRQHSYVVVAEDDRPYM